MQLKKIELLGFKSFADRTELSFDGGITAIVGPNGCGKSNVVDAIRWVLGEQSAKSLRAVSMGDCIFAGTAARKPLGFAEVTLTFDNTSGRLAIEYKEVAVTRRVYGSGEGEYFINREPCRLRDIKELFMGTGVGTTAYSVIEQGEITRIISSDPRELRAVFDEAAGIGLYKARLRAATAKLERVSQNLLRVSDVLAEVEKSLRSVKYQAAKAARYKEMSARLGDLKMNRARRAYRDLTERLAQLRSALDEKRSEAAALEEALRSIEARSEAAGGELEAVSREIEAYSQAVGRLGQEEGDLRHTADICRERIAKHEENESRLSATLDARRSEVEAFEARAVELERRTGRITRRTDRLSRAASTASQRERECGDAERVLASETAAAENEAVEILRSGAKLNNRLSAVTAEERAATQHKERLSARLAQIAGLAAAIDRDHAALIGEKAALAGQADGARRQGESIGDLRGATEKTLDEVEKELKTTSEGLAATVSRKELLEDLQRRRDGISEAARSVLDMQLPGTRGLVAELLAVPRELAAPVENLLGEDAGAVVVESTAAAVEAARRLGQLEVGRAKVISLERAATHAPARTEVSVDGLREIAEQIKCAQGCEPLVNALLGGCLVADDIETAVGANGATVGFDIATAGGEIAGRDGGITGGRAGQAGGLIWRKVEIERLSAVEGEIRGELEGFEARRREICDIIAVLSERQTTVEKTIAHIQAQAAAVDGRIAAAEGRRAEFAREKGVVDDEIATLEEELVKAGLERATIGKELEAARKEGAVLEQRIAQLKRRRADAADAREDMRARVTRFKVKLASSLEKQSSIERQYADARAALEEKAQALETAVGEIAAAREAAAQEKTRLADAESRLGTVHKEANSARVVLAARSTEERALRDEAARLAPAAKEARAKVDAVRQALGELSIEEREASVRLDDVVARAREEFGATTQDLESAGAGTEDTAAVDAEIEELTRKLASMGGVNMEALAELESLESRHKFLAGQRDDLVHAKESLENIITRTRATSRKMFMESFEAIKGHFSEMFRRLFGGGRADCELVNPEDVLESPIQIMAKPPGKEPSNLNLLSGGEKAMAAVALLFAMFATRPSPFLVLDEVDAPLDESNIGRFIDLMGDYLPTCQFVVITHNRRTMAAADTLYGITMEEQGVSKKVSVSFRSQALTPEPVEV